MLALVVVFVLDGVLSFVSAIKDYTLAAALGSMSSAADPTEASEIGFWGGLGVAVAWVAVLLAPGVIRFLQPTSSNGAGQAPSARIAAPYGPATCLRLTPQGGARRAAWRTASPCQAPGGSSNITPPAHNLSGRPP